MTLDAALGALEQVPLVVALRQSALVYPLVNALHIVGIALLFGAIVPLDLRLIGWRRRAGAVDDVAALLLPVAITGLMLAVAAGVLLFATDARGYAASTPFRVKLLLLSAALLNAVALRFVPWRSAGPVGLRIRIAAAASILLWFGVIVLGRLVGYS